MGTAEPYAAIRRLYVALLHLRRIEPALHSADRRSFVAVACGESAIHILRTAASGPTLLLLVQLRKVGTVDVGSYDSEPAARGRHWQVILTTEDPPFSADSCPPQIDLSGAAPVVRFTRPSAVILREVPAAK